MMGNMFHSYHAHVYQIKIKIPEIIFTPIFFKMLEIDSSMKREENMKFWKKYFFLIFFFNI